MSGGGARVPVLPWDWTETNARARQGTDVGRRTAWIAAVVGVLGTVAWPNAAIARPDPSVITTTDSGVDIFETGESRQSCASPQLVQAFGTLADTRDYVRAPGGSFEDEALEGWQVQKARVTDDGSPLRVQTPRSAERHSDDDGENEHSLKVPAGGSALSPAMCVDLHYPIFRFMAKIGKGTGLLRVEVIYPDSVDPVFHTVGSLSSQYGKGWGATADVPLFPERGGSARGMRRVALRFTSVAGAGAASEWRIDDIYVDPRRL
jgi:hypothetical protein